MPRTAADSALPPRARLQRALDQTTLRLARELDTPLPDAPDWSETEWQVALAVAVMHGVSALLAGRLRWHGPAFWTDFLADQQAQCRLRQQRVQQLLAAIDAAARPARLPLLALKGSALLEMGLYAPGERPMSDIDLLCPAAQLEDAGRLLQGLGYEPGTTTRRHLEFVPAHTPAHRAFGEHSQNPVKIELHTRITERLPMQAVDITAHLRPHAPQDGLNAYPSLAALMRHLLFHAAGNLCAQFVRLIHLHDIAALAPRLGPGDWDALLQPQADTPPAWWLLPPLAQVERLFPGRLPEGLLARVAPHCPPLLRWTATRRDITQLGIASLHNPLLPGIEWSRTPGEALRWMKERLHPGPDALGLAAAVQTHHALTSTGWASQPRWQRGLRMLVGQAPRPSTLYSLRRAQEAVAEATSAPYSASIRAAV